MRVQVVDPSAYTPPYDHALCSALARAGAEVELITSRFPYGTVPEPVGYLRRPDFYRHARGGAGSRRRQALKLAEHVPAMIRLRRHAQFADVVHFQWLSVQPLDVHLLPRAPLVLTAHDLLPREPRPGQLAAQRRLYARVGAVIVHSEHGRRQLVADASVQPEKIHVIHHGAFAHLTQVADPAPLPAELSTVERPVVLFFGLLRPYKGLEVLIQSFREVPDADLWVVGRPRFDISGLKKSAPASVRFLDRFVPDRELPALFRRADVIVLPYLRTERFDWSGVLATALAFGKAIVLTDVGSFSEVAQAGAARLVPAGEPGPLAQALRELIADQGARERLEAGARAAAADRYSWAVAAERTLSVYRALQAAESAP